MPRGIKRQVVPKENILENKEIITDELVLVQFLENNCPYVKGDVTKITQDNFQKLSKALIVKEI